jgi:hypothetical protein
VLNRLLSLLVAFRPFFFRGRFVKDGFPESLVSYFTARVWWPNQLKISKFPCFHDLTGGRDPSHDASEDFFELRQASTKFLAAFIIVAIKNS